MINGYYYNYHDYYYRLLVWTVSPSRGVIVPRIKGVFVVHMTAGWGYFLTYFKFLLSSKVFGLQQDIKT